MSATTPLWYLESLDGSGIEYNLPACWRFPRVTLQSDAFARAVDRLVARHEARAAQPDPRKVTGYFNA